ncbi:DUF3137 domain-containing protein [Pedobacter ginsengisoli]|uniref:DUF3137 domain-containing protein n=1 Tax=Pedobacter ginsengisoli TaxID=363852 RepID=UPI0025508966|nr:DUF3137 domain-containing protein [Pedobacter ginsengisoli]
MAEQISIADVSFGATLAELEVQRKNVSAQRLKSYSFIGGGILLIGIGVILSNLVLVFGISGAALLIAGIVFLSKASKNFNDYRHGFKQKVITSALKSVDQSLEFDYENGLSEQDFVSSQLFKQQPDRYSSQDQIFGSAGKTRFSFSEVHAEYKTETRTKNGKQEHWHTILNGIVFCADFNKHFNGITVVRPKDFGNAIGAWFSDKLSIFSSSDRELVKLENPDFEELFVTYSTDQVEARYILTPGMMERLCQLEDKCKYTISVSFIDTQMFIAFPLDKNYFEPPVFKSLLDQKSISEDLSVIRFMYDIVKELDLNTRIWGKH